MTLVPKTDQDGIDIAGIKLPDIAVPIGTYTGWNPLARAPKREIADHILDQLPTLRLAAAMK